MTDEDFKAWRDSEVTRWFMAALKMTADANEQTVRDIAWAAAVDNDAQRLTVDNLNAIAAKAEAYRQIAGAGYDDIAGWHDEEKDDA